MPSKYIGISLMDVAAKVSGIILLKRFQSEGTRVLAPTKMVLGLDKDAVIKCTQD